MMQESHSHSQLTPKTGLRSGIILATFATLVTAAALGVDGLSQRDTTAACVCSQSASYNNALPASHPNNRCATQAQDLSWKTWITGQSRSTQFHFVDLLELLDGHKDKPVDNLNPANPG
jgi:hypothetical protein